MPKKSLPNFIRNRQTIALSLKVYRLLGNSSKRRIRAIVPIYVGLSILDLLGVILLASCGTLAFNLISGDSRPSRIELFLREYLTIDFNSSYLIFAFAISAAFFLILK